jgi:hypothetical protein
MICSVVDKLLCGMLECCEFIYAAFSGLGCTSLSLPSTLSFTQCSSSLLLEEEAASGEDVLYATWPA